MELVDVWVPIIGSGTDEDPCRADVPTDDDGTPQLANRFTAHGRGLMVLLCQALNEELGAAGASASAAAEARARCPCHPWTRRLNTN